MVLPLCTFSDSHLSMHQVSFYSLLYFQRYAPDKLFIAKIKKGSNFVNTGDRVMILAFYNSPHNPLSLYQVSFIYLPILLVIYYRQRTLQTENTTDREHYRQRTLQTENTTDREHYRQRTPQTENTTDREHY